MSIAEYYKWFKKDWAKVGLIVSVFLFVYLFVFVRKLDVVVFVLLLQTPFYMLHQAEEYVFPGGFGQFFNRYIFKLNTNDGPVNENFIFAINMLYIWVLLPTFGMLATIDYRFGLWLPYFSFFAGLAHIALAIRAQKLYNPGLIVSLAVNIPAGLWSVYFLKQIGILENFILNPHLIIGLGVNLLLPVIGVILYRNYIRNEQG